MHRILNLDQLEFRSFGNQARYEARVGAIGARVGAQKLGYNLTVLAPGKRAYPAHSHRVNEEMFFVLDGEGTLRIGPDTFPLRRGDVVACPPGGPETAHQIENTGTAELRYLAVSTKLSPEIVDYPDSGKVAVAGEFPGADGKPQTVRFIARAGVSLEYWDGEV
jgi:uncharacterized cupin superfamily protein